MDLIFQRSGGSPFWLEVGYFDTVLEIKERIEKEQGFPISKQTLIFNGAVLRDDLNVHYSDILDRSSIQLLLGGDVKTEAKVRLLLKMPSSKLLAVEMDAKDSIQRLKEKISETEGAPPARLSVHANGNELGDHKTVAECEGSEVTVGFRAKLRVVAQYGAEKIPVEVGAGENVGDLRKRLHKMNLNLPQEGYFFIYKQNVMDDDRSFRWHHVAHGDTIEIFSGTVSGGS